MNDSIIESKLNEVKNIEGTGTAMVSLYISSGSNIGSEQNRMSQEKSEAQNIKSDKNRKNVEKAIERVNDVLKRYKQTPENGLVVFVGVTEDETYEYVFDDLEQPLEYSDYTCDSEFRTEPLKNHVSPDQSIGLLVIERGGSAIGELRGSNIVVHYDEESNVMGKHNAGGQCLSKDVLVETKNHGFKRIEDVEEGDLILGYKESRDRVEYTRVLNKWYTSKEKQRRIDTNKKSVKASNDHTIFCDSYDSVKEIRVSDLKEDHTLLTHNYSNIEATQVEKISNIENSTELVDIETNLGNFFANDLLVHNSAERFDRLIEEQKDNYFKSVRQKLFDLFVNENNQPTIEAIVIGGTQITVDNFVSNGFLPKALEDIRIGGSYAIDIASKESLNELVDKSKNEIDAIAEQEERESMDKFFRALSGTNEDIHATYGKKSVNKALEYGAVEKILISENKEREQIIDYKEKSENQGGDITVVSDDFSEGEQFWKGFNGLGAILRYKIE